MPGYGFQTLIMQSANGFKNFFPSVVKTLGLSPIMTLVLT